MERTLDRIWYGTHPAGFWLSPLAGVFCVVAMARRRAYAWGAKRVTQLPVPVVVVGNVTVGGTGKTPLVLWLVEYLRSLGYQPGIVTRGYGGRAKHWPQAVGKGSNPSLVGDEPVLLARRAGCPVFAGPDRVAAARALLTAHACDVVVSDDGLQHYALARDIEIAVLDGTKRLGNGRCLPAGPLREPASRLKEVDLVVTSGHARLGEFAMGYVPERPRRVDGLRGEKTLAPQAVHGVAGIGHPERFFALLRSQGFEVIAHSFPDHHAFAPRDLDFEDRLPVIMTEKDAVKCTGFTSERHWYLPIRAHLDANFGSRLSSLLEERRNG